jgi:hypothetical protein
MMYWRKHMDMFAAAPTVATPKKEKGKKAKPELSIGANLDVLAAADAVAKTLKGVQEAYGTMVKTTMTQHFAKEGTILGRRPENVRGTGLTSEASLELRKRDERRHLEKSEVAALEAAGVKIEKKTVQEEKYYFNDAVLADPELREKISKALSLIDFGGESPILKQEKQEVQIVTDESVEQAFAGKTPEEAEALMNLVGTLAIKPKFNGSLRAAMETLEAAGVTL